MGKNLNLIPKSIWMRMLRGIHYADSHRRLNFFYSKVDPWGLDSDRERFRFQETNRLISSNFGKLSSILEIGCGEGHQSEELSKLCNNFYGIDISSKAIDRAKSRLTSGHFSVADPLSFKAPPSIGQFDLVTACEVLYYMRDIPSVLERMQKLGKACFVTFYQRHKDRLNEELGIIANKDSEVFCYQETSWSAVWWRNEPVD